VKEQLRQLFAAVVRRVHPEPAMRSEAVAEKLRGCAERPLLVIAFGKAARSMAATLVDLLPGARVRGLVVPPEPDEAPLPPFEVIAGGHPLPSAGSLRAARRALELARSARSEEHVVFLVSGGGSAILELPADPSVTLPQLHAFYRALVGSGAAIGEINTVRRHLSAVKGGRLATAARGGHQQLTMLISDVPFGDGGGSTRDVASGPTGPDTTTIAD
jgi:glycerate-2-kinase